MRFRRHGSWARLAVLIGGLVAFWAAVGSPLAHLDHELLTAHMVQHLLLMTIAAPLILLGAPAITLPGFLARPIFCWLAGTAVVIWWHIPFAFDLGMRSESWHGFEQATFLAAGLLFWWPVIQPRHNVASWPRWSVPLYLFLATLPCDALSAFLTFCGHVVYHSYLSGVRPFDISALQDQACAGALMWVWVTFAYLIPAVAITIEILSPPRRASQMEVA